MSTRPTFSKEVLASFWRGIDWHAVEEKLAVLQKKLTIAAFSRDADAIERLQKIIVRDLGIKCLAVRHVVGSTCSAGVDNVKWRTPAEMMAAAMSLTSKGYHASPMRQIIITSKNNGKERHPRLPTYYDRAMNVLYGYSLLPVIEAWAERKSFAFRPGRSTQDAHAYVLEAISADDAPEYVVCADVAAYYATIQHSWLLQHAPMDKKVLSEFLNAGIVFAGELFPAGDSGISEGANISPYLGNFVLDGLQKYIFKRLHGTELPHDFANGNLIRFADDVLVFARSLHDADIILGALKDFLGVRGLRLADAKTKVCRVDEGFTFLARSYMRKDGMAYSYPSDGAVERFIEDLRITISGQNAGGFGAGGSFAGGERAQHPLRHPSSLHSQDSQLSQRDLILLLNRKLKGWAGYYRCTDATRAFSRVDDAVTMELLKSLHAAHPKMSLQKLKNRYWYKEPDGAYCYALPDDKSVRLVRLADTLLLTHDKIKTSANPFVDREYMEERSHDREIRNVTGKYRAVWERQEGRCHYCGRPILVDQAREIVQLDLSKPPSIRNSAYIHKMCEECEFEVVEVEDSDAMVAARGVLDGKHYPRDFVCHGHGGMHPAGMHAADTSIDNQQPDHRRPWRHQKLQDFFAHSTTASISLDFRQVEEIEGRPLPASARKTRTWWYPHADTRTIAQAWEDEGYSLEEVDLGREQLTLRKTRHDQSRLKIPQALTDGLLPNNAVYELETHMEYIIKKYGLAN